MAHPLPPDPELERDQQLADLLVLVSEQFQRGERVDWEQLTSQHPDLIEELRSLLPIAQLADDAARSSAAQSKTSPFVPLPETLSIPLPRPFAAYELLEETGRGGMGVVYKARDERLNRHVALKMILRGEHASSEDLARFRAEARAVAKLTHPNIVPVYDVGEHEGQAYFCMQYIAGQTLAQRVDAGPLPSRQSAELLGAIARAVHHAHQQGILHRDLKPSNILLQQTDASEIPMVTDFGLAKRVASRDESIRTLTETGAIVGTPSYMAPEQATGKQGQATPATDVYSLGAILYEMVTGRPPFQSASVVDIILQVRSEEPVRPSMLNSKIDPDLEFICLKCLEKRPEHRYSSAELLAEDLDRYLNSEPVQARTSNLVYFIGRIFRETHHAPVMENWGSLWMWHSLMLFMLCVVTNVMLWLKFHEHFPHHHIPYVTLWSLGLIVWGGFFWQWRRRGGPVTFVERQMAHAWAAGVCASIGTFIVEILLPLPVLTLTPLMAITAGMVYLFKAGTLSGWFYIATLLCFVGAIPMARFPSIAPLLLGVFSSIGFFVPGLQYYWKRLATQQEEEK